MITTIAPRNENIDFLRFVGLALIVLAHVDPPGILAQLRNFDVPLMVIVSALSFSMSYQAGKPYLSYLWSRVKRLVFPVWVFLTLYFIAVYFIMPQHSDLNAKTIQDSYLLQSGIGYIWIIRVFMLVAMTAPLAYKIYQTTRNKYHYFGILLGMYLLQEIALFIASYFSVDIENSLTASVILYVLPYTLIFAYGLHMPQMSKSNHNLALLFGTLVFLSLLAVLFGLRNEFVPTQEYKYPPQAYYLAFALIGCELVWIFSERLMKIISSFGMMNIVSFMGQNSLWIYLWHIPFIKFIDTNFVVKYCIALTGATAVTFLQVYLVRNYLIPNLKSQKIQKNMQIVLTG